MRWGDLVYFTVTEWHYCTLITAEVRAASVRAMLMRVARGGWRELGGVSHAHAPGKQVHWTTG